MYLIMFESYFFLLAAKGSAKIVKRFPKVPIIALRIHKIPAIVAKSIPSLSVYLLGKQSDCLFILEFRQILLMKSVLFARQTSIMLMF